MSTRRVKVSGVAQRLQSTVFMEVMPAALGVTCATELTSHHIEVNNVMLSVLGTMLSFAISLRVGSANDRFNEGRKAWSYITLGCRNMAFLIWLHAPATTLSAANLLATGPEQLETEKLKGLMEKRTMINLLEAFAVACKHYLRGEGGVYYEDLYHLVAALPKYSFPSSVEEEDRNAVLGLWRTPGQDGKMFLPADKRRRMNSAGLSSSTSTGSASQSDVDMEKGDSYGVMLDLEPASNPPPHTVYHYFPPLVIFRPIISFFFKRGDNLSKKQKKREKKERHRNGSNSNVPLEISLFLSGYVHQLISRGTLEAAMYGAFMGPVLSLQDSIAALERIETTPLPFAYSAHLRFSVYIYLLFLPFQIEQQLGWLTLVAEAVASVIFLGFMNLGDQLEEPFGYDDSDLDLDHFCELISAELREIVAHPTQTFEFVFSEENQPFGPDDTRSAVEILQDSAGVRGFHRTLAKHFFDRSSLRVGEGKGAKTRRAVEVFSV